MKTTLLTSVLLFPVIFLQAQIALPYVANFDNPTEQNSWKQYKLGQETGPYEWEFTTFKSITDSFALSHNYPVGGSQTTNDWMVSPELDMKNGAIIDSLYHLMNGFGTPQTADTIALYYLEGNRDPRLATRKIIVHDFLRTDFKIDNTWYSKSVLEIDAKANSGYLAFRYQTVVNWLDIRIDNIQVSAKDENTNGREERTKSQLRFYPNPVKTAVYVNSDSDEAIRIKLFDLTGKIAKEKNANRGESISIQDLPTGFYTIEIKQGQQFQREILIVH